jgi:hypothetical protein
LPTSKGPPSGAVRPDQKSGLSAVGIAASVPGNHNLPARAAKAATSKIPIVFMTTSLPVVVGIARMVQQSGNTCRGKEATRAPKFSICGTGKMTARRLVCLGMPAFLTESGNPPPCDEPIKQIATTAGIAISGLQVDHGGNAGHFKQGNPGGPGRPKGSRGSRSGIDLAQMIVNVAQRAGFKTLDEKTGEFIPGDEGCEGYLLSVALNDHRTYCVLLARVLHRYSYRGHPDV